MGVARWERDRASLLIVAPRLDRSRTPRRRVEESSTVVGAVGPRPGQTAGMEGRGNSQGIKVFWRFPWCVRPWKCVIPWGGPTQAWPAPEEFLDPLGIPRR